MKLKEPVFGIIIDPYKGSKGENTFNWDGVSFKRDNPINNFRYRQVISWADEICDELYSQIGDSYEVEISAEQFETRMLKQLFSQDENCSAIKAIPFENSVSPAERFERLSEILVNNGEESRKDEYALTVCSNIPINTVKYKDFWTTSFEPDDADIVVFSDPINESSILKLKSNTIAFIIDDKESIECIKGNRYAWHIQADKLESVLEEAIESLAVVPCIRIMIARIREICSSLPEEVRWLFYKYSETQIRVEVADVPNLLVGGKPYQPKYKFLGDKKLEESIQLFSSNNNVVVIEGNTLKAVGEGKSEITFSRNGAAIKKQQVKTYLDRSVKSIELIPEQFEMGTGFSQKVEVIADGDNRHTLKLFVSDPAIATIDQGGLLTAHKAGTIEIIGRTDNGVEGSVRVKILPVIESIKISPDRISVYSDESLPILTLKISPENCYDRDNYYLESNNSSVVRVNEDGNLQIGHPGKCIVSCKSKTDNHCFDTCQIEIKSITGGARDNNPWMGAAYLCAILTFVLTTVLPSMNLFLSLAAGVGTMVLGGISTVKHSKQWFWSIIPILISIALMYFKCLPLL